ncbi:histidine kinase dimerization/phospho-acceptor domain-containing protein [Calditerrivibrio nitroreducens]|uniref:histidine kinase dimerization/phospho-acceptor domain-containing protein n=1 Tax=Calditerrivibrio TaxID=545865 RepID=UPI003C774331
MIDQKTNYVIISIRLFIYVLTFFFSNVLADIFRSEINTILFINIGLMVVFFSLMVVFLSKVISPKVSFYIQAIFDLIITSYLILNTGYLDSPYILFFAVVIIYMSFYEGFSGGIIGVLTVIIIFSFLFIVKSSLFVPQYYNFKYFMLLSEYVLSFLLIVFLVSLLNKKYKKQLLESEKYKSRLAELTNLHQAIIENVDFGVMLIDNNKFILSANNSARKIFDIQNLEGMRIDDLIKIEVSEGIVKNENKFIGYKLSPFKDPKGLMAANLFIFQDVSEKEQLKLKLEEERRLADLGRFSSVLAHEIKNPLGAIKGALQLLLKDVRGDDRLVQIFMRELNRLDLILGNMLIISKDNFKKSDNIKVKDILDDFIYYIKNSGIFENLVIKSNLDDYFRLPLSDSEFKQIVWNLLINSYEIKNDAVIDIYNNDNKMIYQDNGPGVDEAIIENFGKPFFTTKSSGTGLGIYTIFKICEKNGISLKVFSNKEFNGFKIEFIV